MTNGNQRRKGALANTKSRKLVTQEEKKEDLREKQRGKTLLSS